MSEFRAQDIAAVAVAVAEAIHKDLTKHEVQMTGLRDHWQSRPAIHQRLSSVVTHLGNARAAIQGMNALIVDVPLQLAELDQADGADNTQAILNIIRTNRAAFETVTTRKFVETTLYELGSASAEFLQAMSGSPELAQQFSMETKQQLERVLNLRTFCSDLLGRLNTEEVETLDGGSKHLD